MVMAMQFVTMRFVADAAGPTVVINEVSWTGSIDSSTDEWIELYNTTNYPFDLSGWYIEDDGTTVYSIENGQIPAHGYFLLEDSEDAVSTYAADVLVNISLANAGDSLVLKNPAGGIVDVVNSAGGAWFAGDSTTKASMERIDPMSDGNTPENWASALHSNGSKGSNGSELLGTPGTANSNYGGSGPSVYIDPFDTIAFSGDTVTFDVKADNLTDFYAYGFELEYPSLILEFADADEGNFLNSDGADTAFNVALKDGEEGVLVVGGARLVNPASGIDGSGTLLSMTFDVISPESDSGAIEFGGSSFIADSKGDVPAKYTHGDIAIGEGSGSVNQIANLSAGLGDSRYSLKLNWQEDLEGASSYIVKRQRPDGSFEELAEVIDPYYLDSLDIVPGVVYSYQVVAVKNNVESDPALITASETRGLKGDSDRSDSVDGRDLEKLARSYGSELGDEEYQSLADTDFNGVIDGSDLIDVGANFGLTYSG